MSVKQKKIALKGRLKLCLFRFFAVISCSFILLIVLFSFLPIPISAYMAEQQLSAFVRGDYSYRVHSNWKPLNEISPLLRLAVIAAEDQHFPHHHGFDFKALSRVISHHAVGRIRGASTISQQTAKNLYLWNGRSWIRKGLEAVFTLAIELVWSKKRILTVYLNIAQFGPQLFGAEAASRYYFHRPANSLTASQAALLAAVLPNPVRWRVNKPDGYIRQRQGWIRLQMEQLGGIGFLRQNALMD